MAKTDPEPTQAARSVAEEFFARLDNADRRDTVGELFADNAVIIRPGRRFEGEKAAEEFLAASQGRYEWAAKEFDRWIEAGDEAVSIGRLYGVDVDGQRFEDVRYVDVFTVVDGEITRLEIWNDLSTEGIVD